ncbi:hypothetical protein J5K06_000748 [Campylobacter jejuni]|nr:hypothetical protein [Campylobacter jejuni]EJF0762713.1 hypothetical protein [Campylobacter jejuni]
MSECYVENPYIASFHSADKIIGGQVYHDFGKCPDFVDFDTDSLKIELFSGCYDKNSKKIYEGDILEYEALEELYHITRDNTYKMFKIEIFSKNFNNKIYKRKAEPDISFLKVFKSEKNMKVIGNIHENADLLVVKE